MQAAASYGGGHGRDCPATPARSRVDRSDSRVALRSQLTLQHVRSASDAPAMTTASRGTPHAPRALPTSDVALWESYKVLLELGEECRCDAAAQAIQGLFFLAGSSPAERNASVAPSQVTQRIRSATAGMFGTGRSLDYIRQADAMIATDVTRGFAGDWSAAADAIEARLLVIVGMSDHVVTPGAATAFSDRLGDKATLIEFRNDCGHAIPGCEMFRSRALVREFLAAP
jgi:pimeloyl-ACP methyl ester carboxylesterase